MIVKGIIKKGLYFDSVSLMIISKEVNKLDGVTDSSVIMGTSENKKILKAVGLFPDEFEDSGETDILVGIKAVSDSAADLAIQRVDQLFKDLQQQSRSESKQSARSLTDALKILPDANLSLISIAGKYAAKEAMKALKAGLHTMVFSDNVSIEEELVLKQFAKDHGLLVMGPDCGSAIINGIPLGFANVVNKGNIGIVAASGTGLQEVTAVISNNGGGISQAIGTGGRDVRKEIGGIMFLEVLRALNKDEATDVIVMISKPPHPDVIKEIGEELNNISKPVVAILIGGDTKILKQVNVIPAHTLEEAGLFAVAISQGNDIGVINKNLKERKTETALLAKKLSGNLKGKFMRGLFSGGTLCDEAQLALKEIIGDVYSNSPLNPDFQLKDLWKSKENSIIDLGEDEFTQGRPHPMIDYSLRNSRIIEEATDPGVAVILLDVVLGYGSHPDPASELIPAMKKAKEISPGIVFICSVTGTDQDPQDRKKTVQQLTQAGMVIMPSNVAASELSGEIIKILSVKS